MTDLPPPPPGDYPPPPSGNNPPPPPGSIARQTGAKGLAIRGAILPVIVVVGLVLAVAIMIVMNR